MAPFVLLPTGAAPPLFAYKAHKMPRVIPLAPIQRF